MNGKRIKAIRAKLKLTQPELAQRVGMSKDAVQSWELERATPNGAALKLLEELERQAGLAVSDWPGECHLGLASADPDT